MSLVIWTDGLRVRSATNFNRAGTIVGRCHVGVHVQFDNRVGVPWVARDGMGDSHRHWAGLKGAPLEGRTWSCVRRGSLMPADCTCNAPHVPELSEFETCPAHRDRP